MNFVSSYLLQNSSDMRRIFFRHFIQKALITLLYTTLAATAIQVLFLCFNTYLRWIDEFPFNFTCVVIAGPLIALLCVVLNTSIFRIPLVISLTWLLGQYRVWPLWTHDSIISALVFVGLWWVCSPARVNSPATYQNRSRRSTLRLAYSGTVSLGAIFLASLIRSRLIVTLIYLRLLVGFSQQMLISLLSEPIKELSDPRTLAACCLNVSVSLAERTRRNKTHYEAVYSKQPVGSSPAFTTAADTFVLQHLMGSVQRCLLQSQNFQLPELQEAARQLSSEIGDGQPHIFGAEETLDLWLCFGEFFFQIAFDLAARLFRQRAQLDSLVKLQETFSKVLRPGLLETMDAPAQVEEIIFNGAETDFGAQFGLDLNQEGTAIQAEGTPVALDMSRGFRNVRVSKLGLIRALLLRQVSIEDFITGKVAEKLLLAEEARQEAREEKTRSAKAYVLDVISLRWAREHLRRLGSDHEDRLVLSKLAGQFVSILEKTKGNQGFAQIKAAVLEAYAYLYRATDRKMPHAAMAVLVARSCIE